jgi:hypothetical protein
MLMVVGRSIPLNCGAGVVVVGGDRGEHLEAGVRALAVVERIDVLEHRRVELKP